MNVSFRPIERADSDFLSAVYASTRTEELALTDWDDHQKAVFLEMQFNAQHRYYQENYRSADFLIILLDDHPVGRLYIARWADEIRIVDITLLPQHRNVGIGSEILKNILAEAAAQAKPVRIHVERFNPAQTLYLRLGFVPVGEHGIYYLLEWTGNCET
jgi:ribosomal protein S18 acetylase RimI-like enzyme